MSLLSLVSWHDYVDEYLSSGLYKARGFFAPYISPDTLKSLLPPYHREVLYDEGYASSALNTLKEIIAIGESEIMVYDDDDDDD